MHVDAIRLRNFSKGMSELIDIHEMLTVASRLYQTLRVEEEAILSQDLILEVLMIVGPGLS